MPGITGIINKIDRDINKHNLNTMISCMMHEPFYTSGVYIDDKLGVYTGWVCHKESFSDCMPVFNEKKDLVLIFSGENFPDQNLENRLNRQRHEFNPSDASALIHLYEEEGVDFLKHLNGWFSGILLDLRKQRIILFNDRYGLGRIYYHENEDRFYFSSEAKSLLKILPGLRQLDFNSLGELFSCGCVLQNRTLFSDIHLLPGGSQWVFNGKENIKKESFFNRSVWENQSLLSGTEYYQNLKETFTKILPKYFNGKRQIAMSLTGGLDSRMIMAWAKRPPGSMPCFTFGGEYRDCADVRIARQVAKIYKQPHETILVDSQFLSEFPSLAERTVYLSDGTMDISGSVELFVNKIACGIAPVRMTGNYGSEIIRGLVTFRPSTSESSYLEPAFTELVHNASETYRREQQCHKVSFIAFKQVPWHHYSRLSVEQSQLTLRSPYLDNDLVALMYQAPPEFILNQQPQLWLIAEGNADLDKIPIDRGLLYRPIPVITKLHQKYMEFTKKAEYAYDYGMPQWLAKIDYFLLPLHIERLFLGKQKFYHFRIWYRDKLSHFLKDILLESRSLQRPYLQKGILKKIVDGHTKGYRNYTSQINRILTLELIQRLLLER